MAISGCPSENTLAEFAAGSLPEEERQRLLVHIDECPACTSSQDRTPQGVMDLGGNVAEWVEDRFSAPYAPCPAPCRDPVLRGAGAGDLHSYRGGAWIREAAACRAAGRSRMRRAEASGDVQD